VLSLIDEEGYCIVQPLARRAILAPYPRKTEQVVPLWEGWLSSLKGSEPPFYCMAKSVSVTTEFDQGHRKGSILAGL
jgi:hypothetical protein